MDRAGREHPLHQKQGGPKQQYLERREVVGERPKHPDPVKHPAYGQTAHRPQGQCDQQCNSHIVQALEGQHVGQLPVTHAYRREHAELLLAGEQIGNQGVGKVNQREHKDKGQDTVDGVVNKGVL